MLLSSNKTDYVMAHLRQHWMPDKRVEAAFVFLENGVPPPEKLAGKIVFTLSAEEQPRPVSVDFEGEELLVLFPLSSDPSPFELDAHGTLWFRHDFLSSCFYLLSGMQELNSKERDAQGRFSYESSIQKSYGFVNKPLVNYYFELLLQGFEAYCLQHKFGLKRRRLFDRFGFMLSHDVDRIAFHHPRLMIYRVLQIMGLRPTHESKHLILRHFLRGLRHHLFRGSNPDPWWNFAWMIEVEKRLGIRSTFFFLYREEGYKNAWYRFRSNKIKALMNRLLKEGFEVGLHGTFRSASDPQSLLTQKEALTRTSGEAPVGIRQHFLRFDHPQTFKHQEAAGMAYDSTLGFHDHDGYRNGYCYPFRPYDFDNDRPFGIWEFPLVMMEVSALQYRSLSLEELGQAVQSHLGEALRFGGLFSLLWHNCRLTEEEYPGIRSFYERLLEKIIEDKPTALTGQALLPQLGESE